MQRASVRFQQRLTERLAERGMRVDEPCRIGKRDTVATNCSASAIKSLAIGLTMCTPNTTCISGLFANAPLTTVIDPPSPLISMRALDSIGYAVSFGSTTSSRAFAWSSVNPTLAASGKENTTCWHGVVNHGFWIGSGDFLSDGDALFKARWASA